jgi:hypothetical protein
VRRYLIIFFVVFLPFQFAWGSAARYCLHEKSPVSHFGHHEHVHKGAGAALSGADIPGSLSSADDPDCDYCHISCAQPLPSAIVDLPAASQPVHVSPRAAPTPIRLPDLIERPNWTLAA